ncbi:MAG: patatin-like phospholipase family protein [Bacillota bacterium]
MKKSCSFRSWRLKILWLLPLILLSVNQATSLAATESVDPMRPKIGLALGGGAALGFAHIGVLKWLEENRIPVDFVAGTSMGGLIGGCYAMGMSPAEIEVFVENIDWDHLFNPGPSFNRLDFRRKEDDWDYPLIYQAGWRNGLKVPKGLGVYGVSLLLSRITLPHSTLNSFDELPIPFRCVAADISNSEKIVMSNGSLAEAMRSTMAIPGLFTPVSREGRLLADGGILDNVPADVVRRMGAENIIAVHLLTNNTSALNDPDRTSVLMGTINTVVEYNSRQSLTMADVVVEPQPGRLNMFSWKEAAQFVKQGYQAAAEQAAVLGKFSVDEETWQRYRNERNQRRKFNIPVPQEIEVTGASPDNEFSIKSRLTTHLGKPLDQVALEQDLTDIMGSELYENIRYEYRIKNGIPVLIIAVTERSYGPPFIDFAFLINADGFEANHIDISPRFRVKSFHVAGRGSELRTDIGVGTGLYFLSELYKPLAAGPWFVAPTVSFEQNNGSLFSDGTRLNDYRSSERQFGLDLGRSFGKDAELRLGYFYGYQDVRNKVGSPLPPSNIDGDIRKARLKWTFSNTNESFLPAKGVDWNVDSAWYDIAPDSPESFGQMETRLIKCFPVGEDLIFTMFSGDGTFEGSAPLMQQFRLGGPFRLGSYNFDEFYGENYLLGNVGYLKFLGNVPLISRMYLGFWIEHGGVFEKWPASGLKTDMSAGIIGSTAIGPIYLGASYGEGSNPFFNILLGKVF